jgi:hypothetical protein
MPYALCERLEEAGLLQSVVEGTKRCTWAKHPASLFTPSQRLLLKFVGIDHIVVTVCGMWETCSVLCYR